MTRLLPQRVERAESLPSEGQGFGALIDEVPVGLVWLASTGEALQWNAQASVLLESVHGPKLEAVVERLRQACATTRTCIQTTVELTGAERVRVSLAPDRSEGQFLVVLDRQRFERARTEASVLRAVLKAVSSSANRRDALQRALEAVHGALAATHLTFYELDREATSFACVAASGLQLCDVKSDALTNQPDRSIVAASLSGQRVFSVADLERAKGLPFASEPGLSAVFLPVKGRSAQGVLAVAARDGLNDSVLRLCAALADAIGAVLDLATLEQEAARAREVASQRDRLATIGQLVAGVAHEINNPLAFLKSNLTSLRSDLDDIKSQPGGGVGEADEIVAESLEGVLRIETIVQALKGTSRKKDERVRFDPAKAIAEAVTIFRGAHKQDVDVECHGLSRLPEVIGSPSALGQVALNLLQNGLDAMSNQPRKGRKLFVSAQLDDKMLRFSFRDHGTGIPADVQRRMFDAFFTTKDPGKGTGLGLPICKEIAESMGGDLAFTTGPDGTCFVISIPLDTGEDSGSTGPALSRQRD
ncbi:MAG: GHKL domain-containing protein [Archangium sp.]|nr:GHKL domain-containing protein [Archangium sp.]